MVSISSHAKFVNHAWQLDGQDTCRTLASKTEFDLHAALQKAGTCCLPSLRLDILRAASLHGQTLTSESKVSQTGAPKDLVG